MRILQDAKTSTPLVSLPQIFTEKKKFNKWYESQSMNTQNLLKNHSQLTQKPTNGTNLKNQQNLLKAWIANTLNQRTRFSVFT